MSVKECPNCDLVSPASAQRCDCGYDFSKKTIQDSYLTPGKIKNIGLDLEQIAKKNIAIGGVMTFGSIMFVIFQITIFYDKIRDGQGFTILTGTTCVAGAAMLLKGIRQLIRYRKIKEEKL